MRRPVPLTPEEKIAGRAFKAAAQAELDQLVIELNPDYDPPYFLGAILRHPCPARGGVSTGLTLKEIYRRSDDGRWGFYYKRGRCSVCGQVGLSSEGKFVIAADRPPIEGRVAR